MSPWSWESKQAYMGRFTVYDIEIDIASCNNIAACRTVE